MHAVLVAAGEKPPKDFALGLLQSADLKIAVDGGLAVFEECGVIPDLMIGDMDSVDASLLQGYSFMQVPLYQASSEKDETDGMLALDEAIARGAKRIVLLGATGGRIDHLLSNLMLLRRAHEKDVKLVICDALQEIVIEKGGFEICGSVGQTVSILPVNEQACVHCFDGLYYPLDHLVLRNDEPRGVSNVLTKECAVLHSDDYVLVIKNAV
ncbi:thiamine diphosphokinase [Christensenella timonensis]|uniref:thiamine diphosphokinase n=1 Tax=Christensenella timonensis TaxID=1816678 RepID=UPI000835FD16|nr:thiamine diphosphokinase [Christensenella timonensis]